MGLTIPSSPFAFGIISVLLRYTSFPHGAPTSASSWTTTAERTVGGCTDTNDPAGQPVNELPLFNTHLVDVNLGYDRLISIAEQQTENWQAST